MHWCPYPNCQYVIIKKGLITDVKCICGHEFCFVCQKDAHMPATCKMVDDWLTMIKKDSQTSKWIYMNTKPCPKCKKPIEKNQGCNLMTCRNCKFSFCWICLGDWATHSNHFNCNTPLKVVKELKQKQEKEKKDAQYLLELEKAFASGSLRVTC
ncbi:MAG: putative Zinc finger, C6HC-type [Streblomastix strix]|uniref:RBR-type E3 ubiquitin transferase n=1 Tax=Streblomastix strix TaxID=222440 RepID=A0A5J4V6J0_9EUKA|nr:MAG: putative Zinc finger, C6HC-type [Streblomastix strix]